MKCQIISLPLHKVRLVYTKFMASVAKWKAPQPACFYVKDHLVFHWCFKIYMIKYNVHSVIGLRIAKEGGVPEWFVKLKKKLSKLMLKA